MGRVKVKFPWLSDEHESWWARIATPMAGGGRGAYFLPEVNDEVLCAFEHGDVRFPYVVGALWNGKDAPPTTNDDGKNNFRERYFYPVYGAARAEVADYSHDGKLDILVTSNFADFQGHPERGIVFLENLGDYRFQPYSFTVSAGNQWNLTATADLEGDGSPEVLVASMNLENIAKRQQRVVPHSLDAEKDAILVFRRAGRGAGSGAHGQ